MNPADFSLVLGGPLYQLFQRTRLSGDALELLHRRVVVLTLVAWAPLLVLSLAEGNAWSGVTLTFLKDIEQQARLLLAIPLLIVAELVVHRRMRPVVGQFVDRGLVPESARETFTRRSPRRCACAIPSGRSCCSSRWSTWSGSAHLADTDGRRGELARRAGERNLRPSLAGWWMGLVSMPLFQFLWLRWYFRLFIWARFLWQVSRIDLKFMPMHPDRCGGLGFLAGVTQAFAPLLVAQGVLLAGMIANRIFYAGATLPEFKVELIGLVAVMLFAVLGPLLVFSLQLAAAKRTGLREHGILAQRYVQEYDRKWLRGGAPPDEPLVGSADIQSLADLGNSFEVVKEMRWAPFTLATVFQLGVTTLVPVLPLMLTMISARGAAREAAPDHFLIDH